MTTTEQHALREALARKVAKRDALLAEKERGHRYRDKLIARALAAEAEITRLKEGIEARDRAHAALERVALIQAGELKRLEPDGNTPTNLDAAMRDLRAARSVLTTIPPKENPDA